MTQCEDPHGFCRDIIALNKAEFRLCYILPPLPIEFYLFLNAYLLNISVSNEFWYYSMFFAWTRGFWSTTFMCVYVCLYPFTAEASVYNDVVDILECTDQQSCVKDITWEASAKFTHLSFWIHNMSSLKTTHQQANNLERKWNNIWFNIWYDTLQICMEGYIFNIGYKLVPSC